jgi:hypothetical protein
MTDIVLRVQAAGVVQTRVANAVVANLKVLAGLGGPRGVAAEGAFYTHHQGVASTVWTINHALGFRPNVTVLDSLDEEVEGDIDYIDNNNLTVTFSANISGEAYLS